MALSLLRAQACDYGCHPSSNTNIGRAGAYKLPGFSDIPQVFNVSLLRDAEWPNLSREPPLFLGASVALAVRYALRSARQDAGITSVQEFRFPLTSERIRLAAGDFLVSKGKVEKKGDCEGFFAYI
ncbi:hypothetical protein H0H93_015627 [Arthromyces matolae]|nr:hypothetical protein H0H93_015627 [Arthromyces matolae]